MENDDNETWVRFSEVGINARMRNALELYRLRAGNIGPQGYGSNSLELAAPAATGTVGGLAAADLQSPEDAKTHGVEELGAVSPAVTLPRTRPRLQAGPAFGLCRLSLLPDASVDSPLSVIPPKITCPSFDVADVKQKPERS